MSDAGRPDLLAIAARVAAVRERMRLACRRARRDESQVTLVAASKTRTPEEVVAALSVGVADFGENRAEESVGKLARAAELARARELTEPRWHMIGHVQSRKAALVVGSYQLLHSLDSLGLARKLDRLAGERGAAFEALVEINIAAEPNKSGYAAPAAGDRLDEAFLAELEQIAGLQHLRLVGLMAMAPIVQEQETARPYFRRLSETRELLRERLPRCDWRHLSMGMSDDYEVAIEEGATLVRIGRAVFGERRT